MRARRGLGLGLWRCGAVRGARPGPARLTLPVPCAQVRVPGGGAMRLPLVLVMLAALGGARAEEDDKKEDVGTVVGIDLGTTYSW